MTTVLVTGGTGFVGRQVIRILLEHESGPDVRLLVHRTPPLQHHPRLLPVSGDLGVPAAMTALCDAVDTVIHVASYLGADEAECTRLNAEGTEALVGCAQHAGVRRFIYLSNAAVYGWASHAGATEREAIVAPATPISRSRARAERAVSAVGGTILRPLFVDGDGDTRFVPAILRTLRRTPFLIGGGRARLSTIGVHDLARAVADLALFEPTASIAGVFHATDQTPIRFRALAHAVSQTLGGTVPRLSVPYPIGRMLFKSRGERSLGTATWDTTAEHRLFLVSQNHWYNSAPLWHLLGWAPSSAFPERLPAARQWYERFTNQEAN